MLSKFCTKGLKLELDERALTYFTILQKESDPDLMKAASEKVLELCEIEFLSRLKQLDSELYGHYFDKMIDTLQYEILW